MVVVIPPEALGVSETGDTVADPGVWYGQVGGSQYCAMIDRELIESGPTWTPGEQLPLGPDRAEILARDELAKIVAEHQHWALSEISIQRLPSASGLWFFILRFERDTGRASQQGVIQVPVSFSGRSGIVKKTKKQ